MAKIIGTPTVTPVPKTDFLQTDPTKADYLKGREHIATKEEWITIANIKLTEDIAMLERTKDINGNPFNCKKVIVSVSLANSHGVSGQDWYFGVDSECKVTWRSTNGQVLSMECCGGIQQYMQYPYAFNLNTSNMFSAFRYDNVETIDKVVLTPPADNPLLSGDTIRIVGVKA